jgi:hypothetical protein
MCDASKGSDMSFAIPLVYVVHIDTREEAMRRVNKFAADNLMIAYIGEPVEFPLPDLEDLDADEPEFVVVVEYRGT